MVLFPKLGDIYKNEFADNMTKAIYILNKYLYILYDLWMIFQIIALYALVHVWFNKTLKFNFDEGECTKGKNFVWKRSWNVI